MKPIRLLLVLLLVVSVVVHAATFTMPAGSNYFNGHLFSTFTGANGAAVSAGQASPLHTFTVSQVGTATGTGTISQFTSGLLPTGSGYPATTPRMGEMSVGNGLGVGGRIRYTFNQALPLGTHVYMQDVDQGEIATLQFYTCAGTLINPSGFDYLVAATSSAPTAAFTATAVTLTNTTGATNQNEPLVAVVIRNATVCRIEYTGIFAGGTFETFFSLPPVNPGITKSLATPNPVLPGGPVSWTLTATNNAVSSGVAGLSNPTSAYGVVISDTVNTSVTGLTATVTNAGGTTGGSCTVGAGNAVNCSGFSPLASGQSIVVTLSGTLSALYNSTSLANTATVANTVANDLVAANNSSTSTTPVTLQQSFGTCDARMYLDQVNTTPTPDVSTLYNVGYASTPFTYISLGTGLARNGIGYSPLDNYIYGIEWDGTTGNQLIRVGADGSSLNLGTITGLPVSNYNNGAISPAGDYYLTSGFGGTTLYRVSTTTLTATTLTMSQSITVSDLAWYNGLLYGVDSTSGQLVSVNPSTGAVTVIGPSSPVTNAIAMWGFTNGLLATGGGSIYAIDPLTGAATLMSSAPASSNADGANCASAAILFSADLSLTKTNTPGVNGNVDQANDTYTPGTNVIYTIVVRNNGPFGAQNVTMSDPLPTGITAASWTCGSATGGAVCGTASGTGAINYTGADLPSGSTLTYTYTITVPANYTGSLSNTATVTPGVGNTDPTPANNTATDTDTRGGTLTIIKDAVPNGAQDFAFTVTGTGLSSFSLDDDADATLSNTRTFTGLASGTYSVTETALAGWSLTGLTCVDPDNGSTVNVGTRTATLDLDAGENITCTYTNTALAPALAITKTSNGPWTVGQTGSTYTLNVSNTGTAATTGTITVRDQLPTGIGIRPASGFTAATGWTCTYSDEAAQSATTIVPNTGMVITCTSSTAIPVGGTVALAIPVVVTSTSPASVTNYASVGGGGDAFNGGAAPTAGTTCIDATHCASVTTSVAASPPAPATCPAGATPVNLFATSPFQSNFFTDNATETRTATLIATAGNYMVGTGTGGRFVVNMNWRWSPGFPQPSNASTMTLRVNGVDYARMTTQVGYPGYATLVALNGATLFDGTTTMETNRTSTENIWVTLPASVTSVTGMQMGYTGAGTSDDFFFSAPAIYGCPSPIDLSVTKTNTPAQGPNDLSGDTYNLGEARTYSVVVTNGSATFTAMNVTVSDPIPAGINAASVGWTCTSTSGGAVCGAASGTGALNDTGLNLPPNAVATYLVTLTVPATFTGDLTNTVTITPPASIIDSNAANNTATDTDTRGGTLTIIKDAVPNGPQDFAFTTIGTGLSSFSLDDDADATLSNTRTFTGLTPGSYSVTETALAGWSLTGLTCVDPDNGSTVNVGTRVATIDLDPGENITCTYTNASSQPDFGSCDGRKWLAQQDPTQLYEISTTTNPFTFPPVGVPSAYYNAVGYNPADNYLYAFRQPSSNELLRIGADGSVLSLGIVSGLPVGFYNGGTFSASGGVLYVKAQTSSVVHAVNVSTLTSAPVNLTTTITNTFDLAAVGSLLYSVSSTGQLYSIDPTTGTVATIGTPDFAVQFGAMFGAADGLYAASNAGGFYKIDLATGKFTLISGAPSSSINDGANCPAAGFSFAANLGITKTNTPGVNGNVDQASDAYTPGTNVVYTIVVSNAGQFGAQNVTVSDPLPAGITTASWTCGSATGGAVCGAASGSGAINDAGSDLPAGSTLTYLYTIAVPVGYTGNLSNTATVAPGPGNTDPSPGNNSATDVDQSVTLLTIRKISVGGVDSFGFAGSNGVVTQTLTTVTAGTPVAGTTQSLTTASTATTITESTSPVTYRVTDITCTGLGAGGTATPDLANRTVVLNAAATAAGSNIVCTFTNTLQQTDIQVVKTASPNPVVSGNVITYSLVVSNNGPNAATNVLLSDTPTAGQNCSVPSTTATCSATGGASCPSPTVPVSTLLGSGITIPALPVGGQVTVTLQCTVSASGL